MSTKWTPLVGLARAFVRAECLPDLLKRFDDAYLFRLRQWSEMTACWGALKDLKLTWQAKRVEDLVSMCPLRKGAGGGTEVDLANLAPLLASEASKQPVPVPTKKPEPPRADAGVKPGRAAKPKPSKPTKPAKATRRAKC